MERSPLPTISLYCTDGGSDKEYHAQVIAVEGGFSVKTRYGKRGAAKEAKGELPVFTFEQAIAEFERIVKDKKNIKKGYTESVDGIGYASNDQAGQVSGLKPHLLVPINMEQLVIFVHDDRYGFEKKIDGERLMIQKIGQLVITANKLGFINTVPQSIVDDVLQLDTDDIILDGESLNNKFHVFDILRLDGTCLKSTPAIERHAIYSALDTGPNIIKVPMVTGTIEKAALLSDAAYSNGSDLVEGIVAKLLEAPYVEGRASASEATQFKYKFVESVSCIVIGVKHAKRSAHIGLVADDGLVRPVGFVGVPVNQRMPALNDIIDVQCRHLYAGGAFCQPVFGKHRNDIAAGECLLSQVVRIKEKMTGHDDQDD